MDYWDLIVPEIFPCKPGMWAFRNRYDLDSDDGKSYEFTYKFMKENKIGSNRFVLDKNIIRKHDQITVMIPEMNILDSASRVKENDVIFVGNKGEGFKQNLYDFFHHILPGIKNKFYLAANEEVDDGDYSYFFKFLENDKIKKFCAPCGNLKIPKFMFIPFGVSMWACEERDRFCRNRNGISSLMQAILTKKNRKCHFKDLLCQFSVNTNTGDERKNLKTLAKNWRFCDVCDTQTNHANSTGGYNGNNIFESKVSYFEKNTEYKFVLCPTGRCSDGASNTSSRVWESLYLGCVPIMKRNELSPMFDSLPVLIVDEWEEINKNLLDNFWSDSRNKKFDYKKMTITYWLEKIKS